MEKEHILEYKIGKGGETMMEQLFPIIAISSTLFLGCIIIFQYVYPLHERFLLGWEDLIANIISSITYVLLVIGAATYNPGEISQILKYEACFFLSIYFPLSIVYLLELIDYRYID